MADVRAHGGPAPVVTRAALDPSLVAGRGADVDFAEQEAENVPTNGTVIGPDRTAYTLPAEASGRKAVKLTPGQHVEFTLPSAANAITVRYSIPDAPNGGGITAPLDVTVNGGHRTTMKLTSQYAWLYNQYPFTNDPNAGLLHPDWWITECSCVPNATTPPPTISKPFRPNHFYDEQRLLLGRKYRAGDRVRLTVPAGSNAAWTVVDLLDSELVGAPHVRLVAANVLVFGADPTGRRESAGAFDKAIAYAKRKHLKVYIPPGVYQVNRHIIVDDVTIEGAGNWYTIIKGREVALSPPAPDGSVVSNNFVRNTGDDGLAMWSEKTANAGNTFHHNTVQTPTLANGIAIYGGTDNTVSNNLIADPIREGSGLHVGARFGAEAFTGHLWIKNNTTVRAGTYELNWNIGLGGIWFYALDKNIDADIQVVGDHYLDNTYNAIMLVSDWPVKDLYSITNVHFKDIRVDGTGTSVVSARVAGAASFENVDARNVGAVGVNNCGSFDFPSTGSEFSLTDLGGNDGGGTTGPWLAAWELPNTITCDDRPPVVAPSAPSPWWWTRGDGPVVMDPVVTAAPRRSPTIVRACDQR